MSVDLFVIASGDGYFKRVSPAVTDVLGYSVDEALKIPYIEMIHPDDQARALETVREQLEEHRRIDEFIGRFRHKDGSYRILSWRSMPRGDLMFATARDVTEEARAAEELRQAKEQLEQRVEERTRALAEANETLHKSERRFRALIENGADSIALIDGNNHILYLSPAVTQVEGYEPHELIGQQRARAHASRRRAGTRQGGGTVVGESGQAHPGDLATPAQGWALDLAGGRGHQPARRSVGARHRHQLPRHHRPPGA